MKTASVINLGTQLSVVSNFIGTLQAAPFDRTALLSPWNELRNEVFKPNHLPLAPFGGSPRDNAALPFFAVRVVAKVREVLGGKIEELAQGKIDRALCEKNGITPELLSQYAMRELLPHDAVRAFNNSAALYLSRRLDFESVTLGGVLEAALDMRMDDDTRLWHATRVLNRFMDAIERPDERVAFGDLQRKEVRETMLRKIGVEIENILPLLMRFGPQGPLKFFEKHQLSTAAIAQAGTCGIISHESATKVFESYIQAEQAFAISARTIRRIGVVGASMMIPASISYIIASGLTPFSFFSVMGILFLFNVDRVLHLFARY